MNRRNFIKSSALFAAAGAVVGASGLSARRPAFAAEVQEKAKNHIPDMQYRPMGQTGAMISAISFGMMRPPMLPSGEVDEEAFKAMVRHAIDNGLNYIDTSHVYSRGKNQEITARVLADGYRDKVYLATKFPWWQAKTEADFDRILGDQLEQLQTDHIDFYLMHGIHINGWKGPIRELKLIDKMEKAREQGKVRHIGFSHHAPLQTFKEVLAATPNWEFFQLQMNYIDTEYQAGLTGIKYAADRGMGVIAMEPLRGGFMADMPWGVKAIFSRAKTKRSDVEWAFNFLWHMPEITTVLSGMSAMQHVRDNLEYARRSSVGMLGLEERRILIDAVGHLHKDYGAVPCNGCDYCRNFCPERVAIPQIIIPWNQYKWNGAIAPNKRRMEFLHGSSYGYGIPACTECGRCVQLCPLGVNPPEVFKEIKTTFSM